MTAGTTKDTRWLSLYVLCTGMLMIILDSTVVNVALPSIQTDLGFTQSSLAWVVNAYLIPFGGLLLLAGRLGDLIGRKTMFMSGLALFVSASALCGLAQSEATLIGARFLQGVGGALTSAVILGMIVAMFPEPREQAKAIGVYAFVASAGASIGLLLGGVLTETISWHWIFFVNVPIGIVAGFLANRHIERDEGIGLDKGADLPGATLITSSLMLGVYTIVETEKNGWGSMTTALLGLTSLALLAGFVWRQATAKTPLVPLRIFRSRNVTGANVVQILMVAGMFGMFFMGALYLQKVQHYTPIEVGLAFLPVAGLIGAVSLRGADKAINRFGARATLITGLSAVFAGLVLLTQVPLVANYAIDLLPSMILFGVGAGLAFPSMISLAMSGATQEDAGLASGLVNTTQQVGGAVGLAVLATLSASRADSKLAEGASNASALVSGYHLAFIVAAGFALAAIVFAAVVLEPARELAAEESGSREHRLEGARDAQPELA